MKRHFQIGWVLLWSVFALTGCRFEGTSATNSSLSSNSSPTASSSSSASSQESNSSSPSSSTVNPDVLVDATPYLKMAFENNTSGPCFIIIGHLENLPSRLSLPETYSVAGVGTYPVKGFIGNLFEDCLTLKEIYIPKTITFLASHGYLNGVFSFSGCVSLEKISGMEGLTMYPDVTNCLSLKNVAISASVTSLPDFTGCPSITSFTVDPKNKSFSTDGRSLFSKGTNTLFAYASSSGPSYSIPNTIVKINNKAFASSKLQQVVFPTSVTEIQDSAFEKCTALVQVVMPTTIQKLGKSLFSGCSSLPSIELPTQLTEIPDSAFSGCSFLSSVRLPDSLTVIGNSAFEGCSQLKSIEFPSALKTISDLAFHGCSSLESLHIPASTRTIYSDSFAGCSALTKITVDAGNTDFMAVDNRSLVGLKISVWTETPTKYTTALLLYANKSGSAFAIPSNVETVFSDAFSNCTDLVSLSIPTSVTTFSCDMVGCTSLKTFYLDSANTIYKSDGRCLYGPRRARFSSKTLTCLFAYAKASGSQYVIPTGIVSLSSGSFTGCATLTSLSIPATVTLVNFGALTGCTSLFSITYGGTSNQWYQALHSVLPYGTYPEIPAQFVKCSDGNGALQ